MRLAKIVGEGDYGSTRDSARRRGRKDRGSRVLAILLIAATAIVVTEIGSKIFFESAHASETGRDTQYPTPHEITGIREVAEARARVNMKRLARRDARVIRHSSTRNLSIASNREWIHPPMPNPRDAMASAIGVPAIRETPAQLQSESSTPSSPPPTASFLALLDNGTAIPPDTEGAVGPNDLMVTLNSQVELQTRTGTPLSTVALASFWSSLGVDNAYDPRVLYDPYGQRWIFSAAANPESANAAILIGVSATSDPTGNWYLYKIAADPSGATWADFPTLGFNVNWIVVQANMFSVAGNSFSNSNVYVFDKAKLYAGAGATYTLLQDPSGFTQFPVATYDDTLQTEYLLETWNGPAGELRLDEIIGPVGSEILATGLAFPQGGSPWQQAAPILNFAPQLGSSAGIDTDDDRILNCVYSDGSLWASQTVFLPASGTVTRSAAQWWQIDTASGDLGAVLQLGRIDDPTNTDFYAYPSIAVNQNEDVLIGYSRFSAGTYASAGYSLHLATDPAGVSEGDAVLMAGEGPYYQDYGTGDNRWGDYSATAVDPLNNIDFWTIQEYASSRNHWGTWWGEINPDSPTPTPTSTPTPTPTPTPTSTPTATSSPTPTPSPTPTLTPTPTPSPTATVSATPTPSPSPTITATPTPMPSPTPASLTIEESSLPNGAVGKFYDASLQISGGVPPYLSRLTSGILPPGLMLDGFDGTISGIPLRAGTWRFIITVTDRDHNSISQRFEILVSG